MNPADKRLSELIDKWLTSLELHLKYSGLDESSYWKVQPWVKHDRPSRWIIELARQKALQLKEQVDGRIAMGDAKFTDALELMGFLTNLVGSQHIARFIPLAEPQNEVDLKRAAATGAAAASSASIAIGDSTRLAALPTQPRPALNESATREMPRAAVAPRPAAAQPAAATRPAARTDARRAGKRDGKGAQSQRTEAKPADPERENKVVADALRLLGWGRQWHELPELISRMADRPALSEVRRILRDHKDSIDSQRSADG